MEVGKSWRFEWVIRPPWCPFCSPWARGVMDSFHRPPEGQPIRLEVGIQISYHALARP